MPAIENLSDLVNADEIRALLGANTVEFTDETLALPIYLRTVKARVNQLNSKLWPYYVAIPDSGSTPDQDDFSDLFLTYCGWQTAAIVAISLPQFSPREITDSKGGFTRQTDSAAEVVANINGQLSLLSQQLLDAIGQLDPDTPYAATTGYQIATFGANTPTGASSNDPVTG